MKIKSYIIASAACLALASCSDDFLKDMKNYESTTPEAYNYYSGALGRIQDLYMLSLPYTASSLPLWQSPSSGNGNDIDKCTEEFSGFGSFVNPLYELGSADNSSHGVPDFFQGSSSKIRQSAWGRIRDINDVINGIENSTLTDSQKDELLGQAYFLRAWCYYLFFKWYGGVPILTEVKDPVPGNGWPRASTKETYDFIMGDLATAEARLKNVTANGGWASSDDYGRPTVATVMALKGRIMVLYASPLFNRANDKSRWTAAYEYIGNSISEINKAGNSLAYAGTPGTTASNWAKMFADVTSPEAIYFAQYNNIQTGGTPDYSKGNEWENAIRPSNTFGGGGKTPSAAIVDLFPMSDGKRPSSYNSYTVLNPSSITYDPNLPFLNRDPRFYRTFAFPGVCWAFDGDAVNSELHYPYTGADYVLWNYVWYEKDEYRNDIEFGTKYGPDGLLNNVKGMYVRKRTDDAQVNKSARYAYSQGYGFKLNANCFMELRYAEVLLNYAEAACQAGHMDVAVEQLMKVRQRVGYTGDCGLQANLSSNEAACMAAILYERQIEFAYEGKRFEDLRRWMLFDGGAVQVPGAPAHWTLTGWGGNTCTYLGFQPLNGQRRENMEFRVQDKYNGGLGGDKFGSDGSNPDPLKDVERPAGVDYEKDLEPQLQTLAEWYDKYLERATKKGDNYDDSHKQLYMQYHAKYYFPGLTSGAMNDNPTLEQTIGWANGAQGNAPGTFDPLAE